MKLAPSNEWRLTWRSPGLHSSSPLPRNLTTAPPGQISQCWRFRCTIGYGRADHASGGPVFERRGGARLTKSQVQLPTGALESSRTAKWWRRCDAKPAHTAKVDIIDSSSTFRSNNLGGCNAVRRIRLIGPAANKVSKFIFRSLQCQ